MGHYASEMMCSKCSQLRCVCPPPPDRSAEQWVVDGDFQAMSVPDFDKKYGHYFMGGVKLPYPGGGRAMRVGREHFNTRAEAEQHAQTRLDKHIARLETELAELRQRRATRHPD